MELTNYLKGKNRKAFAKKAGICITPDEVSELKGSDPEKALQILQKVVGLIR